MKKHILFILFFTCGFYSNAQQDTTVNPTRQEIIETEPEFPGGLEALYTFINRNLIYPPQARIEGIQGKVFVQFIVDVNGKVQSVQLKRGIRTDMDQEALRLVSMLPDWKPGTQNGKPVAVRYFIPVVFKLP